MLGVLDRKEDHMTLNFKNTGDSIFMIGAAVNDIASSEYLYSFHKIRKSPAPYFDLDTEYKIQQVVRHLVKNKLVESAHDVSDGGLFITLVESCLPSGLGFSIETDFDCRADAFLFGEAQSRVVVSVKEDKLDMFVDYLASADIEFSNLGSVTEGSLIIDDESFGHISDAKALYENALDNLMKQ
jgi:phosphoribosylformylglycinamidine synthase